MIQARLRLLCRCQKLTFFCGKPQGQGLRSHHRASAPRFPYEPCKSLTFSVNHHSLCGTQVIFSPIIQRPDTRMCDVNEKERDQTDQTDQKSVSKLECNLFFSISGNIGAPSPLPCIRYCMFGNAVCEVSFC